MALSLIGPSGATQEVDAAKQAARVSLRPAECLGYYSVAGASGALTVVAANGPVFSFRNTGANLILLRNVRIGFITTTAFTTAQGLEYQLIKANSFTASDTGGTGLFVAGSNKHRSSFANITSAPDIRISTTGALTAGTRTLETVAMSIAAGTSNGIGTSMPITDLLENDAGDHPLVFAQNEGFIITNGVVMGAAGVIRLHVSIEFMEASAY
jgi:hypothetical protein